MDRAVEVLAEPAMVTAQALPRRTAETALVFREARREVGEMMVLVAADSGDDPALRSKPHCGREQPAVDRDAFEKERLPSLQVGPASQTGSW